MMMADQSSSKQRGRSYFPESQVRSWLAQIALRMQQQGKTILQLEDIQPEWLISYSGLHRYLLLSRMAAGLTMGIILSGLYLLEYWIAGSGLGDLVTPWWVLAGIYALMAGMVLGMGAFVADLWYLRGVRRGIDSQKRGFRYRLLYYLVVYTALTTLLLIVLVIQDDGATGRSILGFLQVYDCQVLAGGECLGGQYVNVLPYGDLLLQVMSIDVFYVFDETLSVLLQTIQSGLLGGSFFALVAMTVWRPRRSSRHIFDEIRTTEQLKWSWARAKKGLGLGILTGMGILALGLVWSAIDYFNSGLGISWEDFRDALIALCVVTGGIGMILVGFERAPVATKTKPNQGILLTVTNGLKLGGGTLGLVAVLATSMFFLFLTGFDVEDLWSSFGGSGDEELIAITILFAVVCTAFVFFDYAGKAVAEHYIVRWVLHRQNVFPSRLVPFLDYAVDSLHFLQRVGGGYIFVHRYLLEYFADQAQPASNSTTAENIADRVNQ